MNEDLIINVKDYMDLEQVEEVIIVIDEDEDNDN